MDNYFFKTFLPCRVEITPYGEVYIFNREYSELGNPDPVSRERFDVFFIKMEGKKEPNFRVIEKIAEKYPDSVQKDGEGSIIVQLYTPATDPIIMDGINMTLMKDYLEKLKFLILFMRGLRLFRVRESEYKKIIPMGKKKNELNFTDEEKEILIPALKKRIEETKKRSEVNEPSVRRECKNYIERLESILKKFDSIVPVHYKERELVSIRSCTNEFLSEKEKEPMSCKKKYYFCVCHYILSKCGYK
jgi:hypothetical protein